MPRSVRLIPVAAAVAVLAAAGAHAALFSQTTVSTHHAVSSTLHAFVHDDESIGLTYDDGSPVGNQSRVPPTIPPGTYTVKVIDDTTSHNFHLTGPGVEQSTGIVKDCFPPAGMKTHFPAVSSNFASDVLPTNFRPVIARATWLFFSSENPLVALWSLTESVYRPALSEETLLPL